nr:hypothetical protein GCM10020241_15450 [Streptoalloteichus tenebrarius]
MGESRETVCFRIDIPVGGVRLVQMDQSRLCAPSRSVTVFWLRGTGVGASGVERGWVGSVRSDLSPVRFVSTVDVWWEVVVPGVLVLGGCPRERYPRTVRTQDQGRTGAGTCTVTRGARTTT